MNDDGDFTDDDENANGIPDYLDPTGNPAKLYYLPIIATSPNQRVCLLDTD